MAHVMPAKMMALLADRLLKNGAAEAKAIIDGYKAPYTVEEYRNYVKRMILIFYFSPSAPSQKPFMGKSHGKKKQHQKNRKQRYGNVLCYDPKQWGYQTDAHIGTGHLHTDNGLGLIRAKVVRSRVHQTGIHRSTAQP